MQETHWRSSTSSRKVCDLITADHKVLIEDGESRNNHRYTVVVQDLATQWLNLIRAKKKLVRRRKGVYEGFVSRWKNQKSFILTIQWDLAHLVKVYHGNIERRHLIDQKQTELQNELKVQATEEKSLQIKGAEFRADIQTLINRHVILGTLPCVKITSLRQDASMATNAISDMFRRRRSPARSQRMVVRKDQLLVKEVYTIGLCVSRFSSEKVCSTERWKIRIKSRCQIQQGHVAPKINSGKKGSIARNYSKVSTS